MKAETIEDDEFEDWDNEENNDDEKYWFTKDKVDKIQAVSIVTWITLTAVGKVLSFSSIVDVATQLNNNKPLRDIRNGCSLFKNS